MSVATKGYTSHSQRRHVVDKSVYEQHCLCAVTSAKSTASVFVKYFPKPWRTVAKRPATFGDGDVDRTDFAEGSVTFTHPATKNGGTQLVVAYEVKDRDSRVVAVDQQDRELARRRPHPVTAETRNGAGGLSKTFAVSNSRIPLPGPGLPAGRVPQRLAATREPNERRNLP